MKKVKLSVPPATKHVDPLDVFNKLTLRGTIKGSSQNNIYF